MKTEISNFKVGSDATMLFHCYGIVSDEVYSVYSIDGNLITLLTDEDPDQCFVFNTDTGKCINDVTDFGCHRTLEIE